MLPLGEMAVMAGSKHGWLQRWTLAPVLWKGRALHGKTRFRAQRDISRDITRAPLRSNIQPDAGECEAQPESDRPGLVVS
jgi:hypothetical protein